MVQQLMTNRKITKKGIPMPNKKIKLKASGVNNTHPDNSLKKYRVKNNVTLSAPLQRTASIHQLSASQVQ